MSTSTNISTTPSFNSLKTLYLLLAIAGTIVPWFWLLQDTAVLMSPTLFFQRSFANNIATAWASDLLISASVFFISISISIELQRLGSSRRWVLLYVGLTFGIGLCSPTVCGCALLGFAEGLAHQAARQDRGIFQDLDVTDLTF
ncbi:DUF2834 domain-containing protein [Chamaesiphon sp. OTE_75_metabat_556]|uniref:DUF2834 domain-containing protein n=1 Tax=Chamaesiphon sp. OTE_75_metabat_556 TaxID=2964692 RepID=UPI00286BEC7C|nr:DUF2834 domain-containing protein [Chamaesiphon sp. OTE_75_metabat_556]